MFPDKMWGVMQPAQDIPGGQYTQTTQHGAALVQCSPPGEYGLKRPCLAAMRPHVKLLQ